MYKTEKIIKTTALLAGLFVFVGCGGECCTSDVSISKGIPIEKPIVVPAGKPTIVPSGTEEETNPLQPDAVADGVDPLLTASPCDIVHFSDIGTYESDANLTYKWTSMDGCPMSNNSSFDYQYENIGLYESTLTVTDEQNLTAFDRVCVLVGMDELPLVADAGLNQEIDSGQSVAFSGRAICDYDKDVDNSLSYKWIEGDETISEEATFTESNLSVGKHIVKLFIEDSTGNTSCDSVVVTVK